MKISLDKYEMLMLLKRSFPPEMIPDGHEVTDVKEEGYGHNTQYSITLHKKEDATNE